MNLSKYNLNLLLALNVLLQERHVTRAGQRLHLSQSAMSVILKQLRATFHDPLFVRGQASRMIPTPRALALAKPIREFIEKAELVLGQTEQFNPTVAKRTFTLGLSDYAEFVLLPPLVQLITQTAPKIDLLVKHLNFLTDEKMFEDDIIDLAVGIYPKVPQQLVAEKLFSDDAVCVGCKKNPLLKKPLTIKQFARADQLVILYYETRDQLFAEQHLQKLGLQRRAVVTVPHTLSAFHTLCNTHLIAMVMEKVALKVAETLPLAIQPAPFVYPEVKISMVWHAKRRNDAEHIWLRQQLRSVSQ